MKDITTVTDLEVYIAALEDGLNPMQFKWPFEEAVNYFRDEIYRTPPKPKLKDMPRIGVNAVKYLKFKGYNIEYMPGKWLSKTIWYHLFYID